MFGFIDTNFEVTVRTNVPLKDLSEALYVLYYFDPHDPVEVIPKNNGTYDLIGGYYGSNGKRIKKEIENCEGNLIRLLHGS